MSSEVHNKEVNEVWMFEVPDAAPSTLVSALSLPQVAQPHAELCVPPAHRACCSWRRSFRLIQSGSPIRAPCLSRFAPLSFVKNFHHGPRLPYLINCICPDRLHRFLVETSINLLMILLVCPLRMCSSCAVQSYFLLDCIGVNSHTTFGAIFPSSLPIFP